MTEPLEMLYKICIVGDGGVGKTTILHRYVDGKFVKDTMMTIGTNFFMKNILLEDLGIKVKFQVWDLGGQEHFAAVRPSFYSGAKGLIYTYDLTRPISLINLRNWKYEIENVIRNPIPSVLIGNKLDLVEHTSEAISIIELNEMLTDLNADDSFYTSAKSGEGIDAAFKHLARLIFISNKDAF